MSGWVWRWTEDGVGLARESHQRSGRVLRVLVRVAEAGGEVTTNERVIIRHLAERVGVDGAVVDSVLDDGGG